LVETDKIQAGIYSYKISVVEGIYNLKTVTAVVYFKIRDIEREVFLTTEKLKR